MKHLRKRYNRITWKLRRINIDFIEGPSQLAAATRRSISKDKFIDQLFDFLINDGYVPRLPVAIMKKKLHSPYSESESYIFLKINEDGTRLKLVLDIRWSTHTLNEYGNYSAADRKEHYLDTQVVPEVERELGVDVSDTKSKFIDVTEQSSKIFTLIKVDDVFYNNYSEALRVICDKVTQFDQEV